MASMASALKDPAILAAARERFDRYWREWHQIDHAFFAGQISHGQMLLDHELLRPGYEADRRVLLAGAPPADRGLCPA
jgi:hypothetical protein